MKTTSKHVTVLVIDDHEMVRVGLVALLGTEPGIAVVGVASNGEEGLEKALRMHPDVVLMDLVMPKMNGIETTRHIIRALPHCKVIVLTSFIDDEMVYPVLEAGAFSYILKTSSASDIVAAIRAAVTGEPILGAGVTNKILQRLQKKTTTGADVGHNQLSEREMEVLLLIAQGKSNQDIADTLYISVKTVKFHVTNLLGKLDVEDRTQAAIYAYKNGLVK